MLRSAPSGWIFRCVLGIAGLGALTSPLPAGDWPTFRGSERTAVSKESGLLQEWPEDGPPLVWEAAGAGRGYSSLAIAGDRIYALGDGLSTVPEDDKDEYLVCFNRGNGEVVWKTRTGKAWTAGKSDWQSSRSTPTVDGHRVYVLTPHGKLLCFETQKGQEVWSKELPVEFNGEKADGWGYSESVLVDGEQLVCTPGGTKATMVALNKESGDLIWKSVLDNDRGAGHASIVISEVGGTRIYVQTTGSGAIGVRANDGKLLWSYPIDRTTAVCPTPIVRDDLVFFAAGYKRGGALLRQVPTGQGIDIEEVYPLKIELANKHGGIVLVGDYLYGDSDDAGIPFCADLMTGEIQWKKRSGAGGKNSASIAAADGRLYIHFSNGTMVLAVAGPEEYREVGSFKVPGSGDRPSWSHPVVLDGRLYIREQDKILCYDVKAN